MRTNIDLDERLVRQVMRRYHLGTKREACTSPCSVWPATLGPWRRPWRCAGPGGRATSTPSGATASREYGPDRHSAWGEYLRATGSPVDRATEALLEEGACTTDVVVAEVLMGAHDEAHARRLMRLLDRCRFVPTRPLFDFEQAAAVYRACRRGGFTPRSLAHCLVAAVAIDRGLPVLHHDQDFPRIAEHTPLLLVG